MPRIDPIQLLNCLSVLLSPDGGIKSRDEVQRLAKLMTKFSKKLVSKCIYIQILKCTETDLLGLFMGSEGWRLVHMWLTESIVAKNWPLVRELLELLLLCPVDIERLKTNNCPKLVKELSKDGNHCAIRALASKLVEQWLKTVKGGEQVVPVHISEIQQIIDDAQLEIKLADIKNETSDNENDKDVHDQDSTILENGVETNENDVLDTASSSESNIKDEQNRESDVLPVLKITMKNGKQILSQVEDDSKFCEELNDKDKEKQKTKSKDKDKNEKSSNSNSSKSSKHSSRSSSSDKRNSHKESSSKHSTKEKSRDKERHSSHSSKSRSSSSSSSSSRRSSSSSSRSKDDKHLNKDKEKSKEKDGKQSLEKSDEKLQTAISKLGKIPKLSDVKKEKMSISIEVRKPDEPKPKTVKTFHSKFRKHGLEEEMKPPPSRATLLNNKKPPPALPPTVSIPKRPSPVHNETPPEKKPKPTVELEKPGSIKLIPPKPKRNIGCEDMPFVVLQHIYKYICCNFKCGKSKMHNLTGLVISVLKLHVKYLLQIKVQLNKYLLMKINLNLFEVYIKRWTNQRFKGAPEDSTWAVGNIAAPVTNPSILAGGPK